MYFISYCCDLVKHIFQNPKLNVIVRETTLEYTVSTQKKRKSWNPGHFWSQKTMLNLQCIVNVETVFSLFTSVLFCFTLFLHSVSAHNIEKEKTSGFDIISFSNFQVVQSVFAYVKLQAVYIYITWMLWLVHWFSSLVHYIYKLP